MSRSSRVTKPLYINDDHIFDVAVEGAEILDEDVVVEFAVLTEETQRSEPLRVDFIDDWVSVLYWMEGGTSARLAVKMMTSYSFAISRMNSSAPGLTRT
jgi:hypothetical protein